MPMTKVAKLADVPPGSHRLVEVAGKRIALFNVSGKFHAIADECTHHGGPLSEGDVDGRIVTCPWHGARFDVTTGQVQGPPAKKAVPTFAVQVKGDDVVIET